MSRGLQQTVVWSGALVALSLLAACAQSVLGVGDVPVSDDGTSPVTTGPSTLPGHRRSGSRFPAEPGAALRAAGWIRVDDTFWMSKSDADAYARGWARLGRTYVRPGERSAPVRARPEDGYRLRTDHVDLRTNLAWSDAVEVAKRAEAHVLRFLMTYGDVLDLRLPAAPLPVVVHARRRGFETRLRSFTQDPVGWGAFYAPASATVYLSTEPAARGGLPWQADLRHEMTHQILDLARPPWRRKRAFGPGWFWLWEGIALHAETLGDPAGVDSQALRLARFRTRIARREVTPIRQLVALGQANFAGRHYDHTAALMRYLLDPAHPRLRRGTLRCLAELMRGRIPPGRLESLLGRRLEDIERAFLARHGG